MGDLHPETFEQKIVCAVGRARVAERSISKNLIPHLAPTRRTSAKIIGKNLTPHLLFSSGTLLDVEMLVMRAESKAEEGTVKVWHEKEWASPIEGLLSEPWCELDRNAEATGSARRWRSGFSKVPGIPGGHPATARCERSS